MTLYACAPVDDKGYILEIWLVIDAETLEEAKTEAMKAHKANDVYCMEVH